MKSPRRDRCVHSPPPLPPAASSLRRSASTLKLSSGSAATAARADPPENATVSRPIKSRREQLLSHISHLDRGVLLLPGAPQRRREVRTADDRAGAMASAEASRARQATSSATSWRPAARPAGILDGPPMSVLKCVTWRYSKYSKAFSTTKVRRWSKRVSLQPGSGPCSSASTCSRRPTFGRHLTYLCMESEATCMESTTLYIQ